MMTIRHTRAVLGAITLLASLLLPTFAVLATDHPQPVTPPPGLPDLGDAPTAPAEPVSHPAPALSILASPLGGYSVTITSREQVRSFFNTVYQASVGPAIGWTGDRSTCAPGTTLASFRDATQRRINYFRAMAGVPADIQFDDTYHANNQQAALMMSVNNALNHFPPAGWICYTTGGAEAAENSNLALGSTGPDAISGYIHDFGANNTVIGHRRWILYPQTLTMGTGDVSKDDTDNSANSTWVFDANIHGPRPTTREAFVSWPPPGYVPYPVVFPRWSFAYADADFASATVTLSTNGVPIPVTLHPVATGYGENTLVWYPSNLNPNSPYSWPRPAADTVYDVSLQNVLINATPEQFHYTVTVFDPDQAGADTVLPALTGPTNLTVNALTAYSFNAVPIATGYEWRRAVRTPFTATEGAEQGLANFTSNTSTGYEAVVTTPVAGGAHAFHLAHPVAVDQTLTFNRLLLPGPNSQLQFQSRLGWATPTQVANVQVSLDEGQSWRDLYSQPGSDGSGEPNFVARSVSLSNYVGRVILVRFRYAYTGSFYYNTTSTGTGWYIDNLAFTNTDELLQVVDTAGFAGTSFNFTPTAPTNYVLAVRAAVWETFHLDWGPALKVSAANPVVPNVPPTAVCRSVTVNAGNSCTAPVPATDVDNGSSDSDGSITVRSLQPAGPFSLGVTPVVLTVTDNQSATNACATTVTVVDNTLPTITCPATILTNVPAGVTSALVSYPAPTAADNCSVASLVATPASGSSFPLGTNTVTVTAVDGSGLSNSCSFLVIVLATPPVPHDLAVFGLKAPKKISLKIGAAPKPGKVSLTLQNLGPTTETIHNTTELQTVVNVAFASLGACAAPVAQLVPPKAFPVVLAPNKKVKLSYTVTIDCANDPAAADTAGNHADYRCTVHVNRAALGGGADTNPGNDEATALVDVQQN